MASAESCPKNGSSWLRKLIVPNFERYHATQKEEASLRSFLGRSLLVAVKKEEKRRYVWYVQQNEKKKSERGNRQTRK